MLDILVKVFEKIVNNFYKKGVSVTLSDTPDTAYCVEDDIVLPRHLLEQFTAQKLPRFTVLYHELGHAFFDMRYNKYIPEEFKGLLRRLNRSTITRIRLENKDLKILLLL